MHTYTQQIVRLYADHADPAQAEPMKSYMRGLFPFLGIRMPKRTELTRELLRNHGLPADEDLPAVVLELWQLPEREYQYAALALLTKTAAKAPRDRIALLEQLITSKPWWDTVDHLAGTLVGAYMNKYPDQIPTYTARWLDSGELWLQRSVLLFQLKYKGQTDTDLLFDAIRRTARDKDFFIRKAIGWALREYSKTDPEAVIRFTKENELSPLSEKEALKWLERKTNTKAPANPDRTLETE
ncbi:DNA alkylation repair protein [Paenibacillus gansuensis]|uniref:DNA alkylation repair protein n=1 Tax=Paenibacillus gansuensis TaxID=306542 RepID=A0ABW5PHW3_9BACL